MKHGNTIQWVVIAAVVAVGLFVWFKPRHDYGFVHEPTPKLPKATQLPEVVSSNEIAVTVAPIEFIAQNGINAATSKVISMKAWTVANDIVAEIPGIVMVKNTDPQVVVTAAVMDIHDERKNFKGYNIETKSLQTLCSLRVQVLDAASGHIAYVKTLEGQKSDTQSKVIQETSPEHERESGAVEAALRKLEKDDDFKYAVLHARPAVAEVEFSPKPENCDIEIDGKYVGGSPLKRALPEGKTIKVKISKTGFKTWQGELAPEPGMRITRELESLPNPNKNPTP